MTKLIMIDGPPGVGKTTLGTALAEQLPGHRLLLEMDRAHPLHPVPVGEVAADFGAVAHMDVRSLSDLLVERWSSFVDSLSSNPTGFILESYPYQSHARVLWQMNASPQVVSEWLTRFHSLVGAHDPVLVMLQLSGDESKLRTVYEGRGQPWIDTIAEFVSSTAYGRARELCGYEGAVSFLSDYHKALGAWSSVWPYEIVRLEAWQLPPEEQVRLILERVKE